MSDVEARRVANRAAFPGVSGLVDAFRAEFGDGVKVDGGYEAGNSFGVDSWPACAGCSDGRGCNDPKVFCGHRLVASSFKNYQPIEVYRRHGMGQRK